LFRGCFNGEIGTHAVFADMSGMTGSVEEFLKRFVRILFSQLCMRRYMWNKLSTEYTTSTSNKNEENNKISSPG